MRKGFDQEYYNWEVVELKESPYVKSTIKHVLSVGKVLKKPVSSWKVLDVGSGTGQHCFEISHRVKKVVGVEPFRQAYIKALKKKKSVVGKKVSFKNLPIEKFQTNERFDLVLCLATLEHMPNAEASFKKIFDILEPGGLIYLTAPNKFWPYEYHYRLFFLSWLPLKWANRYVRLMKRGSNYEDSAYSLSYLGIRNFFNKFPCQYEFIVPDPNSEFLGLGDKSLLYKAMKNSGIWLLRRFPVFWFFSKGFLMVIRKSE